MKPVLESKQRSSQVSLVDENQMINIETNENTRYLETKLIKRKKQIKTGP